MSSTAPFLAAARNDRVAITGIGLIASVGGDRESVWNAVRRGTSGVRRITGLPGIPDGLMLGAPVDIEPEYAGQSKVLTLSQRAAAEAIRDARIDFTRVDRDRFGCAVSGHMGDISWVASALGFPNAQAPDKLIWSTQWLPNSACAGVAKRFGLYGPRMCHSTACASGLVDFLAAVRAIRDGQCDLALAGSAEALHPLFAAGFLKMRVLADHDDPKQACRPFDRARSGFVMGEGAAMFVIERLDHALKRHASIYAEVLGGKMAAEAHHVTGVDADADSLSYVISATLRASRLRNDAIEYINAHGTGTRQNDVMEARGIRQAMGPAADRIRVSSTKSMLGHLVNAAGSVELAITALSLRDGFVPPTINLTHPDPECDLDCVPLVGRRSPMQHAMKISVAFGGHIAAVALRRWPAAQAYTQSPARRAA